MTVLVVWTLVVATAIVLVLAIYLIAIAYFLYRAGGGSSSHLARLAGGPVAVRQNAAPLEQRMRDIAKALVALRGELQSVDQYLAETVQATRH